MNLKFLLVKDYKQQQKLLLEPEDQEPFQCVCVLDTRSIDYIFNNRIFKASIGLRKRIYRYSFEKYKP